MILYPRVAPKILFQAFSIAARRRFIHEPDLRKIASYASDVGIRNKLSHTWHPGEAESLLGDTLVGIRFADQASPSRSSNSALILLLDLVKSPEMAESDVDALVATAEAVVATLRHGSRRSWMLRMSRLKQGLSIRAHHDREALADRHDVAAFPTSLIGQQIRSIARYDYARRDQLPAGSSGENAGELLDIAFSLAVMRRFPRDDHAFEISLLASSVSRLARPPIAAEDVQIVLRRELGSAAPIVPADPRKEYAVKLSTFTRITYDLGLFDVELDALLVEAEGIAATRGLKLAQMPETS